MKTCTKCKQGKPEDDRNFKRTSSKDQRFRAWCLECSRDYSRRYARERRNKMRSGAQPPTPRTTKFCPTCEKEFPVEGGYFSTDKSSFDGLNAYCNRCASDKVCFRLYSVTPGMYETLLRGQHGVCAICGDPETAKIRNGTTRRLCVDHCHTTGLIRGLLCRTCNVILGQYERRPHVYEFPAFKQYLENPPAPRFIGEVRCE